MQKQELNQVCSRLPEILDHIVSHAIVIFDGNARILWLNKVICDTLNMPRESIIGKTQKELTDEGYIKGSVVYGAIKTKKLTSGIVYSRDGIEVVTQCEPILDDKNNVIFVVGTSTSVKELNALRLTLEQEQRRGRAYRQEIEHLRKMLFLDEKIIFDSPATSSLLNDLLRVAPFDYTVLITGESGVGKEVVAKTLHQNSPRANAPFVPVSIPAIPTNLLESELFGYERGTFTGSVREGKMGLFEISQGGTLFLDEIGDIPLDVQVKILRAIESNEIRRLGGTRTIRLDARIIAATHRPLEQMIEKGLFREDLYYRLSVVPIHIKPLRERPEDIAPLCDRFLQEINKIYHLRKSMSVEALDIMERQPWPGNVRELKHAVERLSVLSDGDLIVPGDVERVLRFSARDRSDRTAVKGVPVEKFEAVEKITILDALQQAGGNKKKAAELLGMTRTKFYRRLAKYS